MLLPKRVKHRKQFRGRMKGQANKGNTVAFGEFGLAALEPFWEPAAKPKFAELLPASRVQEMTLRRVQAVASIRCPPE